MAAEPPIKRVVAFIDGQNLFHSVKWEFGHTFPNYDVVKLASAVCAAKTAEGWSAPSVRFYTGVPDPNRDARWSGFWNRKLLAMQRQGIEVYRRPLKYRSQNFDCPACHSRHAIPTAEEKGIDVRLALDVIRLAHANAFDVALVFSQDQDLSEVADEVRVIARERSRWIKMASAFPKQPTTTNKRGINSTDWLPFDRTTYDACIDPHDYRT